MTEQILWLAIALMGVVIIGLVVVYSRQKKDLKESIGYTEHTLNRWERTKDRLKTAQTAYNNLWKENNETLTDKDILIDEVKRLEKLNDANIVEIFEPKSELSALKAKQPQQCGKCGKWTKPNPVIVEGKPMCQKCFAKRVEIETKQPEAKKQNNPLDLSNVKPGTKVRLSNEVETVTVETLVSNEICVDWNTECVNFQYTIIMTALLSTVATSESWG